MGTRRGFSEFRFADHALARFGAGGLSYQEYDPAYRLGYELGYDPAYRSKDWLTVEMYARRQWKEQHPDKPWTVYKEAVRFAWQMTKER